MPMAKRSRRPDPEEDQGKTLGIRMSPDLRKRLRQAADEFDPQIQLATFARILICRALGDEGGMRENFRNAL